MKWLIEILKKRSWKVYAFMFGIFLFLFFLSFLSSKYVSETEPEKIEDFLKSLEKSPVITEFRNLLEEKKYIQITILIFQHNLEIAIMNYFFGIFFLFSLLLQVSNGFLVGFLLGISPNIFSSFAQTLGFLIVMLLEVIAITATGVEGMYLTYTFFRPEKMWKTKSKSKAMKKTFSQSIKIILLSALLLLIAAIIETLVIYYQVSSNIKPIIIGV
ncbi:MAG: stage II sporulation protein M [Candidatus Aenigmatarchaeota archaeon]